MSLANLVIETQDVVVNGKALFKVRGLCFNDLTALVRQYGEELDKVVDTFQGVNNSETNDTDIMNTVLQEMPRVVATVIALAADEPDQVDKVSRMGLIIQTEAVNHIWRLTIDSSGGLKKVVDSVLQVMKMVQKDVTQLQSTGMS